MERTALICRSIGNKGSVYSLSALHRADNGSEDRYESLIRPALLPEGKVKGLTVPAEELEDAPGIREVWEEVRGWLTHSLVLVDGNSLALFARDLESSGAYLPAFFYLNLKAPEKDFGVEAESLPDPLETLDGAFIRVRKGCPDWETRIGMLKSENQPPEKPAYVFLDCETADASGQICAVGLVYDPPEGKPEEYYTLVNPERPMQAENLAIHGITDEMVKDAPTFPEIWPKLQKYLEGSVLVAHSALSADLFFLKSTMGRYGLSFGEVRYLCTCRAAQKMLPEMENHRLDTLCEHFGIPLDHHNALSDAKGCRELYYRLAALGDVGRFEGRYKLEGQKRSFIPRRTKKAVEIPAELYAEGVIPEKTGVFVLTGDFARCEREEAEEKIKEAGGTVKSSVTKAVQYVVVGAKGSDRWSKGSYGAKIAKAQAMGVPVLREEALWEAIGK